MSKNEVVYSDVKFTRENVKANEFVPSSADTIYSEVKIQKKATEATGFHQAETSERSKLTAERAILLVLIVLLIAAICGLSVILFNNKKTLESLQTQWETEKQNLTERLSKMKPFSTATPTCTTTVTATENQSCYRCESGWNGNGESCYFFSTHKSNWNDSRKWCQNAGADLVKIDRRDEQDFLEKTLRSKMDALEDKFWIGLTDSETEGRWLWPDGSLLNQSLTFWSGKEPDDWKGRHGTQRDGEDCVRMGEKPGAHDLKCWFDRSCKDPHKFICEKPAAHGDLRLVCVST